MNYCPELQNNYPEPSRHPEFIWQSEQTEFSEPAPRVTGSNQLKMLWKTRHFSRNQKISEKVVNQVQHDMKDQVQHDIKERNNSSKTTERNSKMNIIKKVQKAIAFTLAETLVVMGIIGVVAALTIPNLNQSTGDREKVAKLKKVYANLTDAYGRMEAVYGPFAETFSIYENKEGEDALGINTVLGNRLTEFMKVSKNCERNIDQGCFAGSFTFSVDSFENLDIYSQWAYTFVMADGTAVWLSEIYGGEIMVLVDLDGPNKGKNTENNDIFSFVIPYGGEYFANDGIMPFNLYFKKRTGNIDNCIGEGGDCTDWVLQNGNMDYLKADEDGKCPNGTQLSDTVTSCK